MKQQNNNIEELFKDKLHNLEADPGANAWANVQSGISSGAASSSVTAAASSWASSAIVGVIITAVAIGGFFFFNNEGEKKIQPNQKTIESPKINTPVEKSTVQKEVSSEVDNEIDNLTSNQPKKVTKTTTTEEPIINKVKAQENTSKAAIDPQVDEATQIIEEKTIDEILAEHQQFLEEQAAARSNAAPTDNEAQSSSTKQQNNEPTQDTDITNTSNSTKTSTEDVDLREEQKRIAKQVVFPNVFSPDLDGRNDVFKMTVEKSLPIDNIQVSVVNLNGKVVGGFTGIYEGWDGRLLNGNFAPAGLYTYQAIIYLDGKQIPKVGNFSLKR